MDVSQFLYVDGGGFVVDSLVFVVGLSYGSALQTLQILILILNQL